MIPALWNARFGLESMTTPETERRRSKRFPMELPVTVKPQDGTEQKCATRDISAGGVFFFCDFEIMQDSPIQLVMILPSEITGGESSGFAATGEWHGWWRIRLTSSVA